MNHYEMVFSRLHLGLLLQVVGPPTADGNRFGAVTCAARIRDKMNRTAMMVQFTQLFQGLFAYSPRSSLSFSKSCRKMMADGRITPASTCTPRIISCSGARGIRTMPAAAATESR